ncbi:MAG: hypothetical protein EA409_03035 [Saprospirales bacterium]|nr:MAG: hypothetical protein EA409_03035 [Saprospirales bacterium]
MNLFKYLFLILFVSAPAIGSSQTLNAFLRAAEEAVEKEDFYSALVFYSNALEFDTSNIDVAYKVAESARKFNSFSMAAKYYQMVYDHQTEAEYPLAGFYFALMNKRMGNYEKAAEHFSIYLSEYEDDDEEYTRRANRLMEAAIWAQEIVDNPWDEFNINHTGGDLNTPFTEFGAIKVGDSMYFSSMRFDNPKDDYVPKRPITHIILSDGEMSIPLPDSINLPRVHTAHTAFSPELDRVYYTICEYLSGRSIRCDLFFRDIVDGVWGASNKLPDTINLTGYTATQPSVGLDPMTGKRVLYFVSDRPGGAGGLDLWAAEILDNGEFGDPFNLESINTEEDDITPFYHFATNTLYFSSMGYKGLGGFDIYKAYDDNGQWGEVTHLGYPLNTSYDETYYTLSDDSRNALFSSNRQESFFIDPEKEACCFDIYEVDILPFLHLITQTFDAITRDSVYGAVIQLVDLADPENLIIEYFDPEEVEYRFPLDRDRDYMLITNKEGYFPDTLYFNTVNIPNEEDLLKQIYLQPDFLELDVLVFDARTRQPLLGVTVAVVNTDDPDFARLEQLNSDDNRFNFDIRRGDNYRILASRKGYATGTEVLRPEEYEGLTTVEKRIYLDIGSLADFLPLVLYFDNDEPDRRSWNRNTDVLYSETFPPYFEKRDEFVATYTEPLSGPEAREAGLKLTRFFETEVKKGHEDLFSFLEVLVPHLEAGDRVNIYLKGYASPRASREYNFILGLRRINSVKNDLLKYEDGILSKYIDNGLLNIREESFGSTSAPPDVIGDLDDERNSIYSLGASKERRVEIIQIEVGQ